MSKLGKNKGNSIDLVKLFVDDEIEYLDENYMQAHYSLQSLDDKIYLQELYSDALRSF